MLLSGAILQGRYRIERVLGQGGMGAVYLATEELLGGKRVAIKEMNVNIDDPIERQRAVEQFQKEARILATLDHPGLVDVTHYFEEAGKQYLVMAFIDGKTLESLQIESPTYLPIATVLEWMDQLSDVLEYLHGHSPPIIFRDMKPSNVMLDSRHRIRLIDFGIARSFDSGKTATFIKGAGTAGFAPLEQYGKGGTTDPRTDIYAVGATLYCLLTRTLPPSSVDLVTNDEVLVPPSRINPEITPALETVILTMMALKKEDRYQSVAAARQALHLAFARIDTDTRGPSTGTLHPRFCTHCGATAVASQSTCGRCGSPLELLHSMDTDKPSGAQGDTDRKGSPPPPVPVSASLPDVGATQPNLANLAAAAPVPPATPWASGSLSAPTPAPPPVSPGGIPTTPAPAPKPYSDLPPTAMGGYNGSAPVKRSSLKTPVLVVGGLIGVVCVALGLKDMHPGSDGSPTPSGSPTVAVTASSSPPTGTVSPVASQGQASPESVGPLKLVVAPAGALVSLDSGPPGALGSVPLGAHRLEFTAPNCHPVFVHVTVDPKGCREEHSPTMDVALKGTSGEPTLNVELRPEASTITLTTHPAKVGLAVDGGAVQDVVTPTHLYLSGTHELAFHAKGYNAQKQTYTFPSGMDTLKVTLVATALETSIRTVPADALITVDKKPFKSSALAPGKHHVVISKPGYYETTDTIDVRPGKTTFSYKLHAVPPAPVYTPPPVHYTPPSHPYHPPPTEAPPCRG